MQIPDKEGGCIVRVITFIEANILSTSPLFIGDDDRNILVDNEEQKAYLPATSIAGAFRSYLNSIGEQDDLLFGEQDNVQMSKVYIRDAFAKIGNYDIRDGLRIDGETGTNVHEFKIERIYISAGLKFTLNFEIHITDEKDAGLKNLLYKAIKGLNTGLLRFGGHKSSGLGVFKVEEVTEWEYDLENHDDLLKYLKREETDKYDILEKIESTDDSYNYMEFDIKGNLTTPLIIGAPRTFNPQDADNSSIKTGNEKYVIPGSSFKGLLRSRMETIANYFGSREAVMELFGEPVKVSKNDKNHVLSRVFVKESIVDNSSYLEEVMYNRIKLDKFTSGVSHGAVMQDVPVKGSTQFNVIYRKKGNEEYDNYAIGLIILALRDLGVENIGVGGNENIGRGKFRADILTIKEGRENIVIDFENRTISDGKALSKYIEAVQGFNNGGDK